jgi:site-specific recombinase XerD
MKKATKESIILAKYVHTFLSEYAPSQKSQSAHTLRSYEYALLLYINFLETEKKISPEKLCCDCFNRNTIEEWLKWLADSRSCTHGTCNNRLASLRVFLKYLGEKEIAMLYLYEAASLIQRRKEPRRRIRGMSKGAVQTLMATPDASTIAGRRDLALIIFIYSTAARLDEALSMKIGQMHLDVKKPNVSIIGKGNKIRTLYLLPKAVAHMKKHIREHHGENPDPNAYVFYSRNSGSYGKLSQTAISKRLKQLAAVAHQSCAEVPVNLHAHQLRHAKASHWLEDGMNIVQISFLLGHEQVETTMVYMDVTTEHEMKALATLEDENDKKISKKWRMDTDSLANYCGLRYIKTK